MALIMNKKESLAPAVTEYCDVKFAEDLQKENRIVAGKGEGNMENSMFYSALDVQGMLGVSRGKAYQIIKVLNDELAKEGYIIIPGRIPKKLFAEKIYGMAQ